MVNVRIPQPLRKLTGGASEVKVTGSTVIEMIDNLEKEYPGIKDRICEDNGKVRRFVNIYVNNEDIRFLQSTDTPIKDGDEVSIIPAVAGGAEKEKKEKRKVYLTYPTRMVKEPLIYWVGRKFKVVTNIRSASISDKIGLVALELEGKRSEVERALHWFRRKGVKVEPIEQDVVE